MPSKTNSIATCIAIALFLFVSTSLFAQKSITGRVTSNTDAQPLSGATVQLRGTKISSQTKADGTFTIDFPASITPDVLVITSVGFFKLEVPVAGRSSVGTVGLTFNARDLNEIVVTGYTAQKKKDITGAVAVVNVKDLKSVPGTTTESLLQGQAAGVTVINSGSPGGGSNVRIRGITSIGNVDPLVIVDGVQSSLHDLNVNEIESIQVLKDAGSTAIYGVQGANGVIIVTTKKGKGRSTISYDAFYGTQRALKKGFGVGGSQNYADVLWLQSYNAGLIPSNAWFGTGGATYSPPVLPDYLLPAGASAGNPNTLPAAYNLPNNQITKTNKSGTDWFHEIFKPAPITQHTISASGSSDRSSYFFSFGYLDQEGTLLATYLKRYSVRANTVFSVKDHIRIGENAYIFYKNNPQITNQNEGNAISYSYRIPPLIPVYDIAGNYAGTHSFTINNSAQPVATQLRSVNNKGNDWQVNGNAFAEVDFLKHFTVRTSIGGTVDNYYYYYFGYTPYENAEGSTAANNYTEGGGYNSTTIWTNTLNYAQIFGDHSVKAVIGTESKNFYGRGLQAGRSNYYSTNPNYWTLNNGDPSTQQNTNVNGPYQSALYSLFGRVDYAYKDKYLLAGTLRQDQSSIFAPGHRTGVFPSVSAGWRMSQEDFMKSFTFLSELKIRGSWGKSGNLSNVPSTNAYNLYASGAGYSYYDINGTGTSSVLGFYPSQSGNPNTTWEQDIITDIGFDATIKKFDINFDWYKKKVSGLLFQPSLPATAGGASPAYVNFGDIQNTGIDLAISYHGTINRDVHFDLTGTVTSYKSKVVSIPGLQYYDFGNAGSNRIGAFTRFQPGQPIGEFFGYKVTGYFKDAADISKSATQTDAAPGRFKYADINGDGKITDADRTFIGNPNPKFTYGFNMSFSYKNFDVFAFFYGSYGNDIFNYIKYWIDFPQVFEGNVSADLINNSWSPSNLNPKYPIIEKASSFSTSQVVNSWYVEKGSYLRLKTLNIGYTVSPALLKKAGIDKLRFYVQGANLFTATKYKGLDPELQGSNLSDQTNFGIDLGNYPANQKNYNIGINLTF